MMSRGQVPLLVIASMMIKNLICPRSLFYSNDTVAQ